MPPATLTPISVTRTIHTHCSGLMQYPCAVLQFIKDGTDPNVANDDGLTALHQVS